MNIKRGDYFTVKEESWPSVGNPPIIQVTNIDTRRSLGYKVKFITRPEYYKKLESAWWGKARLRRYYRKMTISEVVVALL